MVLMPATLPSMVTSAPPELPGLMAASVWMKKLRSDLPTLVRAWPETMPLVTVCPTPNGLPMASTRSPTSSLSESPSLRKGSASPPASMRRTARSVRSSTPTMVASNSRRSVSATLISSAPSMTWPLVTISPLLLTMTPEPSDRWIRLRGLPRPRLSPKNWRKMGSSKSGVRCLARTTLRV